MKKPNRTASTSSVVTDGIPNLRSTCPIACSLDILGDKWTLVVVRDIISGRHTYTELQQGPERMPTNILAARLKRLEELEIVAKEPYQQNPVRYRYTLTQKGRDLRPVLRELVKWSYKHLPYAVKLDTGGRSKG